MSGGVGPCDEIALPEETHGLQKPPPPSATSTATTTTTTTNRTGFLSFRQLNVLAIVLILSASGMVSFQEVSFVLLSFVYLLLLSRFSFPALGPSREPRVFDPNNRILRLYVLAAAIVGLFLPIAYIFEGIYEGDKEGIRAAAPHVFLLASQVFMEGVAFSGSFSTPIRVFVPVFYNAMRIFTLMEWLANEFAKEVEGPGLGRRAAVGRVLALANAALWSFNLFGFLLPVYMPRAFKMYYSKLLKSQ